VYHFRAENAETVNGFCRFLAYRRKAFMRDALRRAAKSAGVARLQLPPTSRHT